MASGLAVVATGVGSVREMVEADGSAVVLEPDDEPALAAAIDLLAGDAELRQRYGRRGRDIVTSRFPIELMCSRREDLFERLAAEGKQAS